MKAWMMYDFDKMKLETVPDPKVKSGWIVIKIEVAQPSITDILKFRGVATGISSGRKNLQERLKKGPVPLPGHEFSGTIVEVGDDVKIHKVGDRVTAINGCPCGECLNCLEGRIDDCSKPKRIGTDLPGCFAEYIAVPAYVAVKIPEKISFSEGACLQPLSSSVAVCSEISYGDTVAILGQGAMGLYCMQIARVSGARKIIVTDVREEVLEISKNLGADIIINSSSTDIIPTVMKDTRGNLGVDIVFECAAGRKTEGLAGFSTIYQAFDILRTGGTLVQVAHPIFGEEFPLNFNKFKSKRTRFLANSEPRRWDLVLAVDLVTYKRVNVKSLVTHSIDGIEGVPKAFEITANKAKYKAINPAQVRY